MEWMSRADFLEELRRGRAEYDAALAAIPEVRMTEPGVVGEWSVRDVISHVTWFEREIVGILKSRKFEGSDLWNLSQDERNQAIFEENRAIYETNRERGLEDVRAEAETVYAELVPLIEALDDETLNDPGRFEGMPPIPPWQILMGNTYKHYREHAEDLAAWLGRG